jgi:NAD+ dependent glucose-6-phosphate dehydrogenase
LRVVITGAAGMIGKQLVDELSISHELRLLDCRPVPGHPSIVADLTQNNTETRFRRWFGTRSVEWGEAFKGAEVVIHLAEDPHPEATWQRVLHNNVRATWNVLETAVRHRVRRVIYGSSLWAVRALELELAPACYLPGGPKIGSEAQPRPLTPYGIAKACGEITGRMLVDEKKLSSFVAVRIGWYHPNPPETDAYRSRGIGAHDLRSLFRRCVEAQFAGFHVVYGVSAQQIAPCDLSHTRRLLSWAPQQLPGERTNE